MWERFGQCLIAPSLDRHHALHNRSARSLRPFPRSELFACRFAPSVGGGRLEQHRPFPVCVGPVCSQIPAPVLPHCLLFLALWLWPGVPLASVRRRTVEKLRWPRREEQDQGWQPLRRMFAGTWLRAFSSCKFQKALVEEVGNLFRFILLRHLTQRACPLWVPPDRCDCVRDAWLRTWLGPRRSATVPAPWPSVDTSPPPANRSPGALRSLRTSAQRPACGCVQPP